MTKTIHPAVTLKTIESLGKHRHFSLQERDGDSHCQPQNLWADYLNNIEAVEVHYFGSLVEQVGLEMVWLGSKAGVSQAYSDSEFIQYEHGVI